MYGSKSILVGSVKLPLYKRTTKGFDLGNLIKQAANTGFEVAAQVKQMDQPKTPTPKTPAIPANQTAEAAAAVVPKGGKEIQAVMQGTAFLGDLVDRFQQGKDGFKGGAEWDIARGALETIEAVPFPPLQIVAKVANFIRGIFEGIFRKGPCEFSKKGGCSKHVNADGSAYGSGDCCNPYNSLSGKGVMVTEHGSGYKKYPGKYAEIPAGDFYTLDGKGTPLDMRLPAPASADLLSRNLYTVAPGVYANKMINDIYIPDGWAVELYSGPGFTGEKKTLGPGFHMLYHEGRWYHKAVSAKVRGPWSIVDRMNSGAFKEKKKGWVTERVKKEVSDDNILMLMGLDPLRPKQPGYEYYESVWRPGWYLRLSEANLVDSDVYKMVWKELGLTAKDLAEEKVISMEKTLDVLDLLGRVEQFDDKQKAFALLKNSLTVEQMEIAQLLSRYTLDADGIRKIYTIVADELEKAKKEAGVSSALWKKPRFDISEIEMETVFGKRNR